MTFIRWSWKVLTKGFWILGFVPQLLDYISTYVPTAYIPSSIRNLLEKGGNWQLTLVLVGIGLLVSAYLVHLETAQALKEQELRTCQLEDQQPYIVVGFQDTACHLVERLELQLNPLPPKPDFDALIADKRRQLLAKQRDHEFSGGLAAPITVLALSKPNPHYEEEFERYLVEYRDYLLRQYEHTMAADRTRSLVPIARNEGQHPANSVTIELVMPKVYREPMAHQYREPLLTKETVEKLGFTEEQVKQFEDQYACKPPPEPQMFISQLESPLSYALPRPHSLSQSPAPPQECEKRNTSGPIHEVRDGVCYIAYHIEQLVQHRPEDDFDPFFLWLGDVQHSTVWEIPVRITSADLRKPQEAHLILEIRIVEDTEAG